MRLLASVGAVLTLPSLAAAQVTLSELATINLDSTADTANPEFIGSNPSAVAWDGTDLFIAGFNGTGAAADVGIVKVSDALGSASLGAAFGVLNTPGLRGYSGLDVDSGRIAASYDNGGSSADGITLWETADESFVWRKDGRGGSGVAFNPGFPGGDPAFGEGVAWATFGSGRVRLQNSATGADIWDGSNGAVIFTSQGTFFRDLDYEDATGNVWVREGNNVISFVRTGDNALAGGVIVFDQDPDADFVAGQNVAYLDGLGLVVYNDRSSTGAGQDFANVFRVIDESGAAVTADFIDPLPTAGAGYYDFSWDAATCTLAVLDFSNRNVSIYLVSSGAAVGTGYCTAVANSTGVPAEIRATGTELIANNDVVLTCEDMPQGSFSIFLASFAQDFVPMSGGSAGNLCLGGDIGRGVGGEIYFSGATGTIKANVDWAAVPQSTGPISAIAGDTWNFQAWMRDVDGMGGATSNFSNAVSIVVQ